MRNTFRFFNHQIILLILLEAPYGASFLVFFFLDRDSKNIRMKGIMFKRILLSLFLQSILVLFLVEEVWSKKVLSLKDAVEIAIKNNPEITAIFKEKESVEYKKNIIRAEFFPKLYLRYTWQRQDLGKNLPITETHSLGPTLNWNLFSGFSTYYAYQEIKHLIATEDFLVKAKVQEIALRVVNAYLDYLRFKALWEATLADIEDAKLGLKLATKRYEVGLAPYADVLDAEARLKEAEANSINYKYLAEIAKANLLILLNLSVTEAKAVEILDYQGEDLKELDLGHLLSLAKGKRPELLAKDKEIEAQRERLKSIRGEYFPTIDLFSSYNYKDRAFFPDRDREFLLGFQFNFPIFTGLSTPAKLSSERAILEKKNYEKRSLELRVEQEVFSAYQQYLTKRELFEASKATLKKMEENYRIMKSKYENGLASIVELTTVMARLSQARTQMATSLYDWYQSYFNLKKASGLIPGLE